MKKIFLLLFFLIVLLVGLAISFLYPAKPTKKQLPRENKQVEEPQYTPDPCYKEPCPKG